MRNGLITNRIFSMVHHHLFFIDFLVAFDGWLIFDALICSHHCKTKHVFSIGCRTPNHHPMLRFLFGALGVCLFSCEYCLLSELKNHCYTII